MRTKDFLAAFRPRDGDLVYGRAEARGAYFAQFTADQTKILQSRFSPMSVLTAGGRAKLDREGFKAGTTQAPTADDALRSNMAYGSIRRACKFGIGLVAEEAAFRAPRAKIRFVLDGLDMESVARKGVRAGYDRIAVPITTSELRYVYRNWQKLSKFVKFYVGMSAVNAPWDEDWDLPSVVAPGIPAQTKAAWDDYGSARIQKHQASGVPARRLI